MSTRSYIGIKNGDKVKYIYCYSDGYLSYNGVFLNAFYRNIEKVEKLIALGDISAIGYNVEAPKDYNGNFFEASNHHTYMGRHTNTSFVLSYMRDRKEKGLDAKVCSFNEYVNGFSGISYCYYFDTKDGRWYVCIGGYAYLLDKVFSNKINHAQFKSKSGDYEKWEDINYNWTLYRELLKVNVLEVYNEWLLIKGIHDIEFGYVQQNGKRVFGLLKKLQVGEKRRKVLARSACIGDLIDIVLKEYKVSYWGK